MSQIYTELERLDQHGCVSSVEVEDGKRTTRRFTITAAGRRSLDAWLRTPHDEFPVLKHPIALRLMMGSLIGPDAVREMLDDYLVQVAERRAELQAVRDFLADRPDVEYPAHVAEWGLAFFDSEIETVKRVRTSVD